MTLTAIEIKLTESQATELRRMKSYFPFRIVWAAIDPQTMAVAGPFASTTKRQSNKYLRKGWAIVTA